MQSVFFSPYCSCQGAFEIPFLMRAGIPPSFSISSGGEAARGVGGGEGGVSDRRMTAAKVPQSGKVLFCSQLLEEPRSGLRFRLFSKQCHMIAAAVSVCDLHLQPRYLIWHRRPFLQSLDKWCWWEWIQATFEGPFLLFSIITQLRKNSVCCIHYAH